MPERSGTCHRSSLWQDRRGSSLKLFATGPPAADGGSEFLAWNSPPPTAVSR